MATNSLLEGARDLHPGVADAVLVEDLAAGIGELLDLPAPVDLQVLASCQGISSISEELMEWSGYLHPSPTGLGIRVNALHPVARQRFTVAHEVGHTLLPGFSVTTQFRCSPDKPRPGQDLDIERLADVAASEFLLPRRLFAPQWQHMRFGMDALEELVHDYRASRDAVGRRIAHLSRLPVAFLDLRLLPSKQDPEPRLRIHASYSSNAWARYIPRNKSVALGHPLHGALQGELVDQAADLQCLTGKPTPTMLSARAYQVPTDSGVPVTRVLALAQALPRIPRQRA